MKLRTGWIRSCGWLMAAAVLGSCGTGIGGSGVRLGAKLKGKSASLVQIGGASAVGPMSATFKGLYFGELEIVAYSYRPGESVQTDDGFGNGTDWSYWIALQSGHDDGRDNVLTPGQELDFSAMNGDYGRDIDQDYIDAVGEFQVDLFEVYMYRTGVVVGTEYYGMNAQLNGHTQHPLHKYPDWSNYDDYHCTPEFPGTGGVFQTGGQDISVFFARSDWFPTPVLVRMNQSTNQVAASSRTLSTQEKTVIESLVTNGTQRRFYERFVIIPFNGPKVYQLTTETPTVEVTFDLNDIIDGASDLTPGGKKLVYKGDGYGVPFGLTVTF